MPNLRFSSSGVREVTADMEKINQKSREQLQAIRNNQSASIEFDRIVRGINRRNETEQDRYNRLLSEAGAAFKSNKVDAQQYEREVQKINEEMEKGNGRFRQYNQQSRDTFGAQAVARLATFAAGLVSIHAAERLITTELQAQSDLRDRAEQTKATVFTTRQDVRRNLAGESLETQQRVLDQNRDLADRLNISETFINQARASALSASGGNIAASLAAVTGAARFLGDRPGEIGGFAGSLLDLSSVTGTTDASVNLGLLTKVGALSRVVSPQQQAQNIPRALIGAQSFGSTAQGAAALFAALSTGSGDITGASSGTGLIALAQQLRDFEPVSALTTTEDRIAKLQSDNQLARTFLADASFEKTVTGPIEQLLTNPQSAISQLYRNNLAQIPGVDKLGALGESTLSALEADRLAGGDARARAFSSFIEGEEIRRPDVLGREEIENLRRALLITGASATVSKLDTFIEEQFGGITSVEAAQFLKNRRAELLAPKQRGDIFNGPVEIPTSPEQIRQAEALQVLIKELVDINRKQLDAQRQQSDGTFVGVGQ